MAIGHPASSTALLPAWHRLTRGPAPNSRLSSAQAFRKAGWRVRRHPAAGDKHADLVVDDGAKKYVVEVKAASEGRGDRLIPLLSQAILQAQAFARRFPEPAAPLAVVGARRVPAAVADHIMQFAERHAPDVAVGVIDAEGLRSFAGPGLEGLDAKPPSHAARRMASPQHLPDLFSDLNQWMLKILIGQRLPASLISVPREQIRNTSHLAEAANASIMSASRFVNQLANQGFLDEHSERFKSSEPMNCSNGGYLRAARSRGMCRHA